MATENWKSRSAIHDYRVILGRQRERDRNSGQRERRERNTIIHHGRSVGASIIVGTVVERVIDENSSSWLKSRAKASIILYITELAKTVRYTGLSGARRSRRRTWGITESTARCLKPNDRTAHMDLRRDRESLGMGNKDAKKR